MIVAARYADDTNTPIIVTEGEGQLVSMPSFPSFTHYDNKMQSFLDGGGQIDAYDPYYGRADEDIKADKAQENYDYATGLIQAAELAPTKGVVLTPHKAKKNRLRRDTGAKHKKNKNFKSDDTIINYEYLTILKLDDADDEVEALTNRQEIIEWDPANFIWPKWDAPDAADD